MPKIGLGTWNFGGGQSADRSTDVDSLMALRSALELGYRHFDTAEMYAAGHTEELLGRAIRDVQVYRGELFITTKVMPEHLDYGGVQRALDGSLRRLGMDYVDLYLIHWPHPRMNLRETFRALNENVAAGRVRNLGVSNFNLELLEPAQELSETPIFTNQVPYNMSDRTYVKNGLIEYCQKHEILVTAYSPLGQGRLKHSKALIRIARRLSATPDQISLAWLCAQPRVVAIPMSSSAKHQRENLEAADLALSEEDMAALAQGAA